MINISQYFFPTWFTSLVLLLFAAAPGFSQRASNTSSTSFAPPTATANTVWAPAFFQNCAFVCVDIQPAKRGHMDEKSVPKLWRTMGITADDVNAANDYAIDVAYPNARRVVDACRTLHLPMIFVHWGCLYRDGMDLDPTVRQEFLNQHGTNYEAWGHCLGDPNARPADELGVRHGDYVLPKSGQDAFNSSNIKFLLANLGARNLVFIGGHTEACLGRTATSAKDHDFKTLCIADATFNARESTRLKGIEQSRYDHVLTTAEFVKLAKELTQSNAKSDSTKPASPASK